MGDQNCRDSLRGPRPVQRAMSPFVEQHFHLSGLVSILTSGVLGSPFPRLFVS